MTSEIPALSIDSSTCGSAQALEQSRATITPSVARDCWSKPSSRSSLARILPSFSTQAPPASAQPAMGSIIA